MARRGLFRGLFSVIFEDPDYQRLTPHARLVLLTARLCCQAGPAAIFRYYLEVLARQTGLTPKAVEAALQELEREHWIERDGPVMWVRNGLRYDPYLRLSDGKHRKAIERHLEALPRVGMVLRFCDYYEFARPFEDPSKTYPELEHRRKEKEEGVGEGEGEGKLLVHGGAPPPMSAAPPSSPNGRPGWPSPEALVELWNASVPEGHPKVSTISDARRKKAKNYLRQFPERDFWERAFAEVQQSAFLCGLKNGPGHEGFKGTFDWFLTKGRDGTENLVKVVEGRYRDATGGAGNGGTPAPSRHLLR